MRSFQSMGKKFASADSSAGVFFAKKPKIN